GAELVQLANTVDAVAARPPLGNDEAAFLQVAEHPGRPGRLPRRCADGQLHRNNLTTDVSGLARALAPVRVGQPDDVVEVCRRDFDDSRVLDPPDAGPPSVRTLES